MESVAAILVAFPPRINLAAPDTPLGTTEKLSVPLISLKHARVTRADTLIPLLWEQAAN